VGGGVKEGKKLGGGGGVFVAPAFEGGEISDPPSSRLHRADRTAVRGGKEREKKKERPHRRDESDPFGVNHNCP